jgi:DNA-binding winged helix-turn-helix (wHTH) protein
MVEQGQQLAGLGGWCAGPVGEVQPPQIITYAQTAMGRNVLCDVYTKNQGICEGGLPCMFMSKGGQAQQEDLDTLLRRETPGGMFVMDTNSGEILTAPHLPSKHEPIFTTPIEGKLLEHLARNQGIVFSRGQLSEIFAPGSYHLEESKTVNMHITRIRRKIGEQGDVSDPTIISARGRGYQFAPAPRRRGTS